MASVAMKLAPLRAKVTARFCPVSAKRCSAVLRLAISSFSALMAPCNWPTLGLLSALGTTNHSNRAVARESTAVTPLLSAARLQSGCQTVQMSSTWVVPQATMKALNSPGSQRLPSA